MSRQLSSRFFAISWFIPKITDKFKECGQLEIRASNDVVRRYLDGQIDQLSSCVHRSQELKEEIMVDIIKSVDGM